jgi:glycerophosphoryl diester phosphodiesterase
MRSIDEIISGSQPRPLIIAHRGASHYYHENTMEAFEAAVDMQAEMIEFDVHRTADGILVIHHDPDISGKHISTMTMEETRLVSSESDYIVPTLVEVLQYCKDKLLLDIELKEAGYEEQVLNTVLDLLTPDQFIITSVHDFVIRKIKDLQPSVRTGFILSSHPRWQLMAKLYPGARAHRAGADVLVASQKLLKLRFLSTTRDLGLPIWIYTVNERHELWKMIKEERISAIFTNRPDVGLLLRDLYTAGQRSEPSS